MTDSAALPTAKTIAAQKPAQPAPNVGVSFLASFSAVRKILSKYSPPKRPYRSAPLKRAETDEDIWAEIDRTAPSRSELDMLRKHFRSQ